MTGCRLDSSIFGFGSSLCWIGSRVRPRLSAVFPRTARDRCCRRKYFGARWRLDSARTGAGRGKRKIAGEGAGKSGDGCRAAAGRISKRRRQKKKHRRRRDFNKDSGPGHPAKEKAPEKPGRGRAEGRERVGEAG